MLTKRLQSFIFNLEGEFFFAICNQPSVVISLISEILYFFLLEKKRFLVHHVKLLPKFYKYGYHICYQAYATKFLSQTFEKDVKEGHSL